MDIDGKSRGKHGSVDHVSYASSIDTIPFVIMRRVFLFLDIDSLLALENTSHNLADYVSLFWEEFCLKRGYGTEATVLCVAWEVNPASFYSYEKASQLCNDPVRKWRLLATRKYLVDNFKCVICEEFLRDMCGLNGFKFAHDVLLCHPSCIENFSIYLKNDVV